MLNLRFFDCTFYSCPQEKRNDGQSPETRAQTRLVNTKGVSIDDVDDVSE